MSRRLPFTFYAQYSIGPLHKLHCEAANIHRAAAIAHTWAVGNSTKIAPGGTNGLFPFVNGGPTCTDCDGTGWVLLLNETVPCECQR